MRSLRPAETRRVLFFSFAEDNRHHPEDTLTGRDRPKPARDIAPGQCWAFKDHRTVAQLIAEGLL
jgi:hypothetical protein